MAKAGKDRIDTMHRLLDDAGYTALWGQSIKSPESRIEAYSGSRGVIMVQYIWHHGGVHIDIYHTDGVPAEWSAIGEWLKEKGVQ